MSIKRGSIVSSRYSLPLLQKGIWSHSCSFHKSWWFDSKYFANTFFLRLVIIYYKAEVYSEPCQIFKMELLLKKSFN